MRGLILGVVLLWCAAARADPAPTATMQYNSTPPSLTNGNTVAPQSDAAGNQNVNVKAGSVTTTPSASTPVTATTAVASNYVLKAAPGTFFGAQVNTTSAAEYVMLFNATALPSNGAVMWVAVWQVPANSTLSISENPGLTLSTGITLGCSTTGPYTLTASALCGFGAGVVQ